jgi:8-oxo-dGTP pyrophosphatase MutT (NUDIX family)
MEIRDEQEQWPVLGSEERFSGHVISVRTDTVEMVDGQVAQRDYVVHPGAVGVVALDEADRVLLVRQYRHPVGWRLWELPAGLLDHPGENPLAAAKRELYEETHQQAADWRVLIDVFTTPGGSDEAIRCYLARGVREADGEQYPREHEEADMATVWVDRSEVVRLILAGELHNPLTVAGVLALSAAISSNGLEELRQAEAPWPARPF